MSLLEDDKVSWSDFDKDHVIKKQRVHTNAGISRLHWKVSPDNMSGEYTNGDEFDVGASVESHLACDYGENFNEESYYLNKGTRTRINWDISELDLEDMMWDYDE